MRINSNITEVTDLGTIFSFHFNLEAGLIKETTIATGTIKKIPHGTNHSKPMRKQTTAVYSKSSRCFLKKKMNKNK
tara:strand:- start:18782 stop:19009 length:228 start_codon:yes stop_codon:yes gene_type:complete